MAKDQIRLMHALFVPEGGSSYGETWSPAVDVYHTRSGWLIKVDAAGIRPEDIQIQISGSRITIKGMRRDCQREEGCSYYRMEISYSQFERSLELPCLLEKARIAMDYRDGMLLVHIHPEVSS